MPHIHSSSSTRNHSLQRTYCSLSAPYSGNVSFCRRKVEPIVVVHGRSLKIDRTIHQITAYRERTALCLLRTQVMLQ